MKDGQPNGAELIITGRARIDDTSAEVQVSLRIAVVKNIAVLEEPRRSDRNQRGKRRAYDCDFNCARAAVRMR